jgi:trans-2,3-dihydro-3-hydroxyanthranilate isomerase
MKKANYFLMDVFTHEPFSGNQLAIFPDGNAIEENLLPKIAKELNLSETVYLYPPTKDLSDRRMRIFTPENELPTAGHPTVGTALFITRTMDYAGQDRVSLMLEQKIGNLKVEVAIENNLPKSATMFQPLPSFGKIYENRKTMAELVGIETEDLLDYPIQIVSCGNPFVFIPVKSIDVIKKLGFRLDRYNQLKSDLEGAFVYVFSLEGETEEGNLHGRMFAPEAGILEDPATGSANGPLGCYVTHYQIKKGPFVSEQGFEMGRPSLLQINIDQNISNEITAVKVGGEAVLIGKGEIYL